MENQAYFDKIGKRFGTLSFGYDLEMSLGGLAEESRIRKESIEALHLKPGDTVLDLCCGTGLNFKLLEQNIGQDGAILGLDLTPEMLSLARARCQRNNWNNVNLVHANLLEFHSDRLADGAISTASIGMIPEYPQAIERVMKFLKPGGIFVIVDARKSTMFPGRAFNQLYHAFAQSAGFDIKNRDLAGTIRSNYEVVYYQEYWGGFGFTMAFKGRG